jgi:FkbM family methyltransferase
MKMMKKLVRNLVRSAGYEIRRNGPESNPIYPLVRSLEHFGIDLVFDVGANAGQFGSRLREAGYRGAIVSFEPLANEHARLSALAQGDPNWHVHERGALGDRDGTVTMNVAGNSVSSSVLPMLELHSSIAKQSAYVGTQTVPIFQLDTVAAQYLRESHRAFLKIDAQGYEWEVLNGAKNLLPNLKGILCELSLAPLYEGQHLWMDVIQRLEQVGFDVWSFRKGFSDPHTGRTLQVDAAFFRV